MPAPKQPSFRHYGFLTLPDFSMIALVNAIEVLRMANDLSGEPLFRWSIYTADGRPARASNGGTLEPTEPFDPKQPPDILFACGGMDVQERADEDSLNLLREAYRRMIPLGALCTGTYALAKAGLLDGYRCAVHWENLSSLREMFPETDFSDELFVIDRDRYTCTGGIAPVDLFINLLMPQVGQKIAVGISDQFSVGRLRGEHDRQHIPLAARFSFNPKRLVEAASLMEANIEEPLALDEIARQVNVSQRQLQRLFRYHLEMTPARYYLRLRLERARELLKQTEMPVISVAIACGFRASGHFSKCYRDMFGTPPSAERRSRKQTAPVTQIGL